VQEIAAASGEQNQGVGQLNATMSHIAGTTQQTASASEQLSATAEELSAQAAQLQELIGAFRLSQADASASAAAPVRHRPPPSARPQAASAAPRGPAVMRRSAPVTTVAPRGDIDESHFVRF